MLCNKSDITEWEFIQHKIDVIGSLEEDGDKRIKGILELSFHRLPVPALKQCFAFCSLFPKDFVMEKDLIVQLWMAEGFLQPSEKCTMEEIGNKYFRDLIAYSLFQEEDKHYYSYGSVCCKMHDLVHDLASSITEGETVIYGVGFGSQNEVSKQVRHLNLIDGVPTNFDEVAEKLRTLFLKGCSSSKLLANPRRLRVASFHDRDTKELPHCLSKLKSLAFLDVSGTQIKELPDFISELFNLQTFRYTNCYSLNRPPKGIENLLNLRHIYFSRPKLMPANLGRLSNLQTLPFFAVGKESGFRIEELGSLKQLKGRLEICNLELVGDKSEAEGAKLQEKKDIEVIKLVFNYERTEFDHDEGVLEGLRPPSTLRMLSIEGYGGNHLPPWVSEMKNLVELKITACNNLRSIPQLEGFFSLKRVAIKYCDQLRRIDDGAFGSNTPKLEEIEIRHCRRLENVLVDKLSLLQKLSISLCDKLGCTGENLSFPKGLKYLCLSDCRSLGCIPSLNGFTSLRSLEITNCMNLSCIPSLVGSISLRKLKIGGCPKIELLSSCTTLESLEIYRCVTLSCLPSFDGFTSLKIVRIHNCANLVFSPKELEVLPSLVSLYIQHCPNLRSNPPIPEQGESLTSLDHLKSLCIYSSDWPEAFLSSIRYLPSIQVLELVAKFNGLTPLPPHLQCYTTLKKLRIDGFQVESLPLPQPHELGKFSSLTKLAIRDSNVISIPQELKVLPSLLELEVFDCPKLRSFPAGERGFSCLTSLRRLTLGGFSRDLEEFPDLSSFPPTPNLEYLCLYGWEKLTQLPPYHQIQQLGEGASSLKELKIWSFNNSLEALPEWLGNLSSLQTLKISCCNNLKHFPSAEAIRRLSKLHRLEIDWCPMLKESCAKGSGSEWSKISHIPNIKI